MTAAATCARCGTDPAEWRPYYQQILCTECFHDLTIIDQASESLQGLLDHGSLEDVRLALMGESCQ